MIKRSSEILENLKTRKEELESDIVYLSLFKDHFIKYDKKVFNKNVLQMKAGNVKGWGVFNYNYLRLNAFKLNNEGFTDYRTKMLKDQYVNISYAEAVTVPAGKVKDYFKAKTVNAAIDAVINAKKEELETIKKINEGIVIDVLSQYNKIVDQIENLKKSNDYILNIAGINKNINSISKAKIDKEGYRPIDVDKRLKEESTQYNESFQDVKKVMQYRNLKTEAIQVLKNNGGSWLENNTLELINIYGAIVSGDREYCTIYPLCEDKGGVVPCVNVSISRGCLC